MISFITEVSLEKTRIHFAVTRMETQKRGGGLLSPLSLIVLYIPQKCEKRTSTCLSDRKLMHYHKFPLLFIVGAFDSFI